jgi:hypothetical protein
MAKAPPSHSGRKTVLARFVAAARRLLGGASRLAAHGNPNGTQVPTETTGPLENPGQEASRTPAFPYDEALLERARTQWQFGKWTRLAALTRDTLQHQPGCAKLALQAATIHQQLVDMNRPGIRGGWLGRVVSPPRQIAP